MSQGDKTPQQIDAPTLEKMVRTWAYAFSRHATERLQQRNVDLTEVHYVLRNGALEAAKHAFDPEHGDWNYAVRGKTADGRELRVVIAVLGDLLIVTVIDLDK